MEKDGFRILNKMQTTLFMLGGLLMVAGVGCFVFMFQQELAGCVFLVGALLFATMQCMQAYNGRNLTLRRLKSIMNLADLLFVLAGVLMIDTAITNAAFATGQVGHQFLRPLFSNQENYIQFVYNKWLVLMIIAVMLEIYTTHRISHELSKQSNNEQ